MTPAPAPAVPPAFQVLDAGTVRRRVTVSPSMCGHNSLFLGQIGDWTWETVGSLCDTDVLAARNAEGDPAYLAFFYYRVRGSRVFHLRSPTFGDELDVLSRSFDFGSESVLTVHRISATVKADTPPEPWDPAAFHRGPAPGSLHVENFNRWVSRRDADSNRGLMTASPPDFHHTRLPALPEEYSPRPVYGRARSLLTFCADPEQEYATVAEGFTTRYCIDITRDLNGVGLVYFASYFSFVDLAVLRQWRELGRGDRAFLRRKVIDQQLCYAGNADPDSEFEIAVTVRAPRARAGEEIVDVVVRDADSADLIAVSTQRVLWDPEEAR
ncbi:LnmK family bifunctional acyltransferase/decarboxylase [Streptomyces sp. SID3212]|uniref:LnmK family bifunctional acyltransferase/decarboxylase n=1 Tax=Streptomyces sp. SID3212 TaxID=2690259 RepID=UPI00136DA2E8|nr:LnmK family bifunctional acyltransferase/decarboxylase [Streptomyces sp. SID3212]MYV54539.1 biosynthesis cluster domain-containing protein [Streptomyces sp. SID3212]